MTSHITDMRMGYGIAHTPIAIIAAPPGCQPGEMASLTRYLNEQPGIRAIPGYHGLSREPVLRISGVPSASALLAQLGKPFADWQEQRDIKPAITLAADCQIAPLEGVKNNEGLGGYIAAHADRMAGFAYTAGNIGLLSSALHYQRGGNKAGFADWQKLYAASAYTVASGIILAFSGSGERQRAPEQIVRDAWQQSSAKEPAHTGDSAIGFLQQYPWEVAAMLNMSGALGHLYSARSHMRMGEALAVIGTLTGMSIAALVPEKGGRAIFGSKDGPDGMPESLHESIDKIGEAAPLLLPLTAMASAITEKIEENPLKISAGFLGAANVGYGVSALLRPQKDMGLLASSAAYISGNILQSFARKQQGVSLDELATNAAQLLQSEVTEHHGLAAQQELTRQLAQKMAGYREVVQSPHALERAIASRLAMADQWSMEYYSPAEQRIMAQNPFVEPERPQRVAVGR